MSDTSIHVNGDATVRKLPSKLLIVGSIEGAGETLSIAFDDLETKKSRICSWLKELESDPVEFGEPRLPEQREQDVHSLVAKKSMAASMFGVAEGSSARSATVLNAFQASWNLEGMNAREVLVFSDRLRVEAEPSSAPKPANPPTPDLNAPNSNYLEMMQQMRLQAMASMERQFDENRETCFLFCAELADDEMQKARVEAFQSATKRATLVAQSVGKRLGTLTCVTMEQLDLDRERLTTMHRLQHLPLLKEVSLDPKNIYSENPRAVEFHLKLHYHFSVVD